MTKTLYKSIIRDSLKNADTLLKEATHVSLRRWYNYAQTEGWAVELYHIKNCNDCSDFISWIRSDYDKLRRDWRPTLPPVDNEQWNKMLEALRPGCEVHFELDCLYDPKLAL